MKKVFLISSHCEDEEKKNVLKHNIEKLKSFNFDVILYSTIKLEKEITDLVDGYFYTNINPVFKYPVKSIGSWRVLNINNELIKFIHFENDYGWAGVFQYKNLLEIAKLFDYELFYVLIYDVIINEELLTLFENNEKTLFFSSKHLGKERIWPVGSHLICLTKSDLELFLSEINLDNYLSDSEVYLEVFIERIVSKYGWEISNILVQDEINRYNEPFLKNNVDGVNFYFINDYLNDDYGMLFFDMYGNETKVEIDVDERKIIDVIYNDSVISFDKPINSLKIKINDKECGYHIPLSEFNYSKKHKFL